MEIEVEVDEGEIEVEVEVEVEMCACIYIYICVCVCVFNNLLVYFFIMATSTISFRLLRNSEVLQAHGRHPDCLSKC